MTVRENALFFLLQASIIELYFLIHHFYTNYELKRNVCLSKNVVFLFSIPFRFCQSKKSKNRCTLKCNNSIENKTKATCVFVPQIFDF